MARVDTLKNFLTDVADKFRAVLGTTDAIPHSQYDTKIDEVYDAGKQAEYDIFWDALQNYGNQRTYIYTFAYANWNDVNYAPKYIIKARYDSLTACFMSSSITDTKVDIDASEVTSSTQVFNNAKSLKTIRKIKVGKNTKYSGWFNNCVALESVTFEGEIANDISFQYSTLLNKASQTNIIGQLSTTTTGKTVTFSKTAVNNAFGINVDDPTTYPEGSEFYELRNSKSNWTFSYA